MSMKEELERQWNERQLAAGVLEEKVLSELVRRGARAIQTEAGLIVDGLAGPKTIAEVESQLGLNRPNRKIRGGRRKLNTPDLVPIPTKAGIETVYGSFPYTTHPSIKGAIIIDKAWVKRNIVKCVIPELGQYTYIHRLISDEFKEIYKRAVDRSGYHPKKMWSWVARRINWSSDPDKPLSMHSYGAAVDFDWDLNPYGKGSGTPMHENPRFYETFEEAGWTWGGRWRTPDPHHFERVRR